MRMSDSKKKNQAKITRQNVLESLKDLGASSVNQTGDLLKSTSEDFFKELMGLEIREPKRSGDINPGESLDMKEAMSGTAEENRKLKAQISMERRLSADEKVLGEQKMQELRVQLQSITIEIGKLATSTQNLATETQVAMIEAPAAPGVYHIIFFEKILTFLQSFRKKIDDATLWLSASNKRAEKKNYWNMYKKKGSSFLLSPDHYLQRSAG